MLLTPSGPHAEPKTDVAAFNNKGLYFKTYRRGPESGPLCANCTFVGNSMALQVPPPPPPPSRPAPFTTAHLTFLLLPHRLQGPGGSALVELPHMRVQGEPVVQINHQMFSNVFVMPLLHQYCVGICADRMLCAVPTSTDVDLTTVLLPFYSFSSCFSSLVHPL